MGDCCLLREVLNSDWNIYSGSTVIPESPVEIKTDGIGHFARIELPPFTGRMFDVIPAEEDSDEDEYQGKELEPVLEDGTRNVVILEMDDE